MNDFSTGVRKPKPRGPPARAAQRHFGISVQYGDMAHLATRNRRLLAVKMQRDTRIDCQGSVPARLATGETPQVTQEIDHCRRHDQVGRAQRQSAQGAHLLLELAGDAGFDRQMS